MSDLQLRSLDSGLIHQIKIRPQYLYPFKIKEVLKGHQHRNLTIFGKVTLLNALVTPHTIQVARLIPIPQSTMKHIDNIIFKFYGIQTM